MSILAFLDPKFQKICSKCQIFHQIIKQICLIDHYFFIFQKSFFLTGKAPSGSYRTGPIGQKKIIPTDLESGHLN